MFAGRSLQTYYFSAGRRFLSTANRSRYQPQDRSRRQSPTFSKNKTTDYRSEPEPLSSHGSKKFRIEADPLTGLYDAVKLAMMKSARSKRQLLSGPHRLTEGLPAEVLAYEGNALLAKHRSNSNGDGANTAPVTESSNMGTTKRLKTPILSSMTELELEIEQLSSTGDGLAYSKEHDHVFVVPFSVPGDRVLAKTFPQVPNDVYTMTDFLKVLRPSEKREGVTPGCKYFTKCSGCQLQMLPYTEQLLHKKSIVERAFQRFSNLDQSLIPPVGDTIGSPLEYGYRTKLTPHYDKLSPGNSSEHRPIGFNYKGGARGKVLDIEHCPIGTPIVNEGMKVERQKIRDKKFTNSKGATILLRESTRRTKHESSENPSMPANGDQLSKENTTHDVAAPSTDATSDAAFYAVPLEEPLKSEITFPEPNKPELKLTYATHEDTKTCVSDHKGMSTEYVGDTIFENVANSFFQNNNSILATCINYVRQQCTPTTTPKSTAVTATPWEAPIKYLLDAYCGSGLFAVSLAPSFTSTLGIDVDIHGIKSARKNAEYNKLANAGFITADASTLFQDVPFPPGESLVLMDPPRKGASLDFLQQLCQFGARRVIYISCNVHTQARDVGLLVQGFGGNWRYEIESLRGFDFFPQTSHVEGVCVLNRVRDMPGVGGLDGEK
ncbi:hypothetical protein LTR84_009661 [Exophiala bonariae]|uniref:TRAM domain-containing protein n=1 Tax=Exophiala bonariae TaxID=1690606 RepID=A0AAV9NJD3_9EURO|nr:hypothetical protein LTR84_009661 [Exophiala bonariae]